MSPPPLEASGCRAQCRNEHHKKHYASVICIGASLVCGKNSAYALRQAENFMSGRSVSDFAAEDYDENFKGRSTIDNLTDLSKRQMGIV